MTETLIYDLILVLAAGLLAGLVCRKFQISILVGYLVVGAVLGKGGLGWVLDHEHQLEHFAEAGVFLLLFSIGLEFSLDDLQQLGRRLLIGGSVQMSLVFLPVALGLSMAGVGWQAAVLLGAAISFSSTVLVFKALSERGQSEQPHGRQAIAILLFQDAALVPLLLLVPLLTGGAEAIRLAPYLWLILTSVLFVIAVVILRWSLARYVIPAFAKYRSPELVVLFTIVSLAGVTLVAHSIGLPPAVGAFAAGLIFNGNRWTNQIDALVLPFRETFAAIFFVGLGLVFDPSLFIRHPLMMFGMLLGVILIKFLAATIALSLSGLNWSRAAGMGIGLAHVGEFAFVLVLLGAESGVLTESQYQQVIGIAVGSLVLTPTLMKAGLKLVRSDDSAALVAVEDQEKASRTNKAAVVGAGPIGRRLAANLETQGKDVCLIDLSPINLHAFALEGFRTVAGDATEIKTLLFADVDESDLVAISVPDDNAALHIIQSIRRLNQDAFIIVRCRFQMNERKLIKAGADRVVSEEAVASIALLKELSTFQERSSKS